MSEEDSLLKAQRLLDEAKEETSRREKILSDTKVRLAKLEDVHIAPNLEFEKTHKTLERIGSNLEKMIDKKKEVIELTRKAKVVQKGIEDIFLFTKRIEELLKQIKALDEEGRYEEAFALTEQLNDPVASYDYGTPLLVQEEVAQILPWTRARLTWHQGEARAEEGLSPLSVEEARAYMEDAANLPIGVEDFSAKERVLDEARGFLFLALANQEEQIEHTRETFFAALEHDHFARECAAYSSDRTNRRAEIFKAILTDEYNELALRFFDEERDYDKALELFHVRGYFAPASLTFPPYRFSYDDEEFRICFLESEALKITPAEFEQAAKQTASEIKSTNDFSFRLLSHYLALQGIDEYKSKAVMDATMGLSYQWKITLLSKAMQLSMPEDRVSRYLELLANSKERYGVLDEMSDDLLYLREHIKGYDVPVFSGLLKELIRSPKAHRIAIKSRVGATHALFGEDRENFPPAQGALVKDGTVKAWSLLRRAIFYVLGMIFPLAVVIFSISVLFSASLVPNDICALTITAPLLFFAVWWWNLIRMYYGRDEKGSALNRRIMFGSALLKGGIALFFFIAPTLVPQLGRLGYGFLIAGIAQGAFAFFALKPLKGKRVFDNLLFLALLIVEGVGLAFVILDMMNGLI